MKSNVSPNLVLAAALVAVTALAYFPGLSGPFLFDDWASLPGLGASGPIHDLTSFLRYVTSGTADPTGRPLALASFVLNARDWPAASLPFKVTNLLIHLANALLLAGLLRCIGRQSGIAAPRLRPAAWFAAALWALHPFLVSTVLYVVQREAMLATTFALLALIAWFSARDALALNQFRSATLRFLGAGIATLLAILSKANGVVIPLLVLAIEVSLPFLDGSARKRYRRYFQIAIVIPAAALIVALAWLALSSAGQPPLPARGWTIGQRLMTEPLVMLDYIARIWLLRPAGGAFFHDQLAPVTSLLDPLRGTLPLLTWIAALGGALAIRRTVPSVAVAVLFFTAGHALESTSVPLELYFEHRNYLPAALMFWPLSLAIISSRYAWLRRGLPIVLLAGLFVLTRSQTTLWGDQLSQARVWADLQPDSPRAQANAAGVEYASGQLRAARVRIDLARHRFDNQPQIALNLIDIHCASAGVTPDDLAYTSRALESAPSDPGALMTHWFDSRIGDLSSSPCRGLDGKALSELLASAGRNPRVAALPGRRQDIEHLFGTMALLDGHADKAADLFARALAEEPTAKVALYEAALLGDAGSPALGVRHLDRYAAMPAQAEPSLWGGMPWIHAWLLRRERYWPNEIVHLRNALAIQAAAQHNAENSSQDGRPPGA